MVNHLGAFSYGVQDALYAARKGIGGEGERGQGADGGNQSAGVPLQDPSVGAQSQRTAKHSHQQRLILQSAQRSRQPAGAENIAFYPAGGNAQQVGYDIILLHRAQRKQLFSAKNGGIYHARK